MRVCLVLEDSYPFTLGGVGRWTHYLVSSLEEIDFTIASLTPTQRSKPIYPITPNISRTEQIPLNPSKWRRPLKMDSRSGIKPIYEDILRDTFQSKGTDEAIEGLLDILLSPVQDSKEAWRRVEKLYVEYFPDKPFRIFYLLVEPLLRSLRRIYEASTIIPDVDIYHSLNTGHAGLLALILSRVRGKPLIVTEHGLFLRERRHELESTPLPPWGRDVITRFFQSISTKVYRYADKVTTVCEYNRDAMIQDYKYLREIQVIRNPVDPRIYRPRDGVEEGELVGTVARLVPSKGIHHLIQAAKTVCERRPKTRFVVVASIQDKGYLEYCEALIDGLGLRDRFQIVERGDPRDWYPRFSVYVQPSLLEASPLSVLEAMASGVPVISTRVGGLPEMVDGCGILTDPGDIHGMAEGICLLLEDPRRRELGLKARHRILELHSLSSFTRAYRSLYQSLLGGKGG